jgi:Tfp pilus assembly protein PilF
MRSRGLAALVVGLLSLPARADVVYLRNGGKLEGKVTEQGDKLRIETATGTLSISKEDVLRIERKEYAPPARTPAPSESRPVRLGGSYSHPFLGVKLQLPRQWSRGKEQGNAAMSFYGPKDGLYTPRMDLFVQNSTKELPDFVGSYKDAFRKGTKNPEFEREQAVAVRDRQGYRFVVTFEEADFPARQQAVFTFLSEGARKIVLGFNCSAAWYGRYRETVEASMQSLRLYPVPALGAEDRQAFLMKYQSGERAYREQRLDDAKADFEAAAALLPGFPDVHTAIGTILLRQNRLKEAEAAYRKGVEIDPQDIDARYNLGLCLLKARNHDAAIAELKKAVELDPHSEPARTNLGVAFLSKDLPELAKDTLREAVELDPESAAAHYNLAVAYERLDRKKDAEHEYKQTLVADPKHAEARKALDRLGR